MKNLFKNLSPKSLRTYFSVVTICVVAVCMYSFFKVIVFAVTSNDQCGWLPRENGKPGLLIVQVLPGGVTDVAGIKNGDILLKINGNDFALPEQAQGILNSISSGDYAVYTVERDGKKFEARVEILKLFNVTYLASFLLGAGFLIVGYIVVMTKPQGAIQKKFAYYSLLAMLTFGLTTSFLNLGRDSWWVIAPVLFGASIARIFGPPVFITFFLNFPVRRAILDKKLFVIILYSVNILLSIPLFFGRIGYSLPNGIIQIDGLIPLGCFVTGLIIFSNSYETRVDALQKRQLRHILYAVGIGVTTIVYIFVVTIINPFIIYLKPAYLSPALLLVAVPVAFGYAIFKYKLMDIDLLVKRSLMYGTVTTLLAAIYILFVYGIGTLASAIFGHSESQALTITAFLIIAFALDPVKRRTQEWIDRSFYRERYNYQKALLEFSQELPRHINLKQILNSMVHSISFTMHVEKIAVILCDETEGCFSISQQVPDQCCQFDEKEGGLLHFLRQTGKAQSFALLASETESVEVNATDKQKLIEGGIILSVPMFLKDRLIGIINVGPKMSGKIYSQEDMDLLTTVATQAAIAIENARLHQSEVERQKIEKQLEIARQIQQGLLPKSKPVFDGLDISGVSIPALTVGGDYFDYIQLSTTKLLVVVADVSGKGMSAALYMSKIQGMIQLAAHMYKTPKEMLIHVNRRIFDGIERKSFITMILALFDIKKKEVRICRAGHNKALIGINGKLEFLSAGGIGLGLERGDIFEHELEEIRRPLRRRALFTFYSDGLTEAMNPTRLQFGEEKVIQLVKKNRNRPADAIHKTIISEEEKFRAGAEQHDDITLVVVKVN